MTITNQAFEYGVFQFIHGTLPSDLEYGVFNTYLVKSTRPPLKVSIISPQTSNQRFPRRPVLVFDMPADLDGNPIHAIIEFSSNSLFSTLTNVFDSRSSQAGFEYSTDGGVTYLPFPSAGVVHPSTIRVRYTLQQDLAITTHYWRVFSFDGSERSVQFDAVQIKTGNKLTIKLKNPIETSALAKTIVPTVFATFGGDAELKMFVTNNAFDTNPVWEDASATVNTEGQSYGFRNLVKTSAKAGIDVRFEINSNTYEGAISIDGFGFSFN